MYPDFLIILVALFWSFSSSVIFLQKNVHFVPNEATTWIYTGGGGHKAPWWPARATPLHILWSQDTRQFFDLCLMMPGTWWCTTLQSPLNFQSGSLLLSCTTAATSWWIRVLHCTPNSIYVAVHKFCLVPSSSAFTDSPPQTQLIAQLTNCFPSLLLAPFQ